MPVLRLEDWTDSALVERFRHSEADRDRVFTVLMRRHYGRLYRLVYSVLGHPEETADALQEVMLKLYWHLPSFRGQDAQFSTWAYQVALNHARDVLRRRQVRQRHWAPEPDPEQLHLMGPRTESPHEELERAEDRERLWRYIRALPEPLREALVLRDVEGLDYETIARITGVSLGTVKTRIFRARRKIIQWLRTHAEAFRS
ncbi:MAG: sigma-70 family RNA polymerase sigma factor [Bacteroidetes bacterium]|nr:sigma-70 family RNA polymerase sigma factor [Rhodothermia bacterium]MCS7154687.1 sigma-70 family RNA polymerase sigma factor [Bacteroidota bacterium]MCX7907156.1 sigma-70 family RNA polymerase sigma factor [Bacteroidota bacterium]MDW8137480.1 sigma-70 family RNA polymerase sigma factor [Bacteroidota bacterium]MDW8285566.1 sigma-70 family RNA polymerase sigma factor [Bacteroidota bacterium]